MSSGSFSDARWNQTRKTGPEGLPNFLKEVRDADRPGLRGLKQAKAIRSCLERRKSLVLARLQLPLAQ